MACSPAQLLSNLKNARRSTGPKTAEGKQRSRRNGLKHGLTGEGVVLSHEDAAEVDRRFAALEVEMAPSTELAAEVVKRVALMTLRLDRSAQHEAKAISYRMRHAAEKFDDARVAEMEQAYSWIASEPATNARRLRSSPEGLDRLIQVFESLKAEILHPDGVRWTWRECEQLHYLMGRRRVDVPVSRARALTDAINGDFQFLRPSDGADLAKIPRQQWAVGQLVELIEAEIEAHRKLREGFDMAMIELDRAEAPYRAIFDVSNDATLARKYESASERGLYRAIREFRELEAETKAEAEALAQQQVGPDPAEELGSCFPEPPGDEDEAADVDEIAAEVDDSAGELPRASFLDDQATPKGRIRADFPAETPQFGSPTTTPDIPRTPAALNPEG